jgi:hypothetical protein
MKTFNYQGVDKRGRAIRGSTTAESKREVKAQLAKFGFSDIEVEEEAASPPDSGPSEGPEGQATVDLVQKLVDGDIEVEAPVSPEEIEEDEWRRAESLARISRYRHRENIALVLSLILVGTVAAYFIYQKMTEIPAPQPKIITSTASEMLTLKDVYVKGDDLVFVVFSRNWNGNVRVDFQAWDVFDERIDFGMARIGFVGEYLGGSPEKSGTFKLKKSRFYERIEIMVSGDEGK